MFKIAEWPSKSRKIIGSDSQSVTRYNTYDILLAIHCNHVSTLCISEKIEAYGLEQSFWSNTTVEIIAQLWCPIVVPT